MAKVGATGNAADTYEGIYVNTVLVNLHQSLPDAVYASDAVKGVSLNLVWGTIEPERGVYDWATLDREVLRAVATGKEISLAVIPARQDTPGWLFDEGAQKFNFDTAQHGSPQYGGAPSQAISIAAPWDPIYQAEYANMMNALAQHLHSIPGAYEAVSVVKITGVSENTQELKLPSQVDGDYNAVWQGAGYTPEKVIDAWKAFADATSNAFADKIMALAVCNKNAFPLIDNNGHVVTTKSASYVDVTKAIVSAGVEMFGDKFMVMWGGLGDGNLSNVVTSAVQQGALAAFQTNHQLKDGVGVGPWNDSDAPTDASYYALLEQGIIKGGASYLEVWAKDALKFENALSDASNLIAQDAGKSGAAALAVPSTFSMKAGVITTATDRDDTFVFHGIGDSPLADPSRIKGFEQGADKIDLSDIDANSTLAGNQNFAFIGTGEFTHHAGELHVTSNNSLTTISGDVDGDGKADFSIQLRGSFDLKKSDFIGANASTVDLPSVVKVSAGDTLNATARNDTFVFNSIADSPTSDPARIKNFTSGVDHLDLSHIDANQQLAGNQHFTFIGDGAFTKQAGQLHETYTKNLTLVSGDVNGDGKADFTIELRGHVELAAHDFIL
jgi:Peptidase M10 serralysin C terminal/Beta-galactosidase